MEDAKEHYYDDIINKLFYGFYSIKKDCIVTREIDLLDLSSKLNEDYDKNGFNLNKFLSESITDNIPSGVTITIKTDSKEEAAVDMKEKTNNIDSKEKKSERINVKQMKEFMDSKIIGQDDAKKDVISAIFMNSISNDYKNKNSCLLVGPTGSGKTMIAETVAEYLNLPVAIVDTTQLTIPGFVGGDIEDYLIRLLDQTNGDLETAEHGIVVFDELDKKGSENNAIFLVREY